MEERTQKVIVAADNVFLRKRLEGLVRLAGYQSVTLGSSFQIRKMALTQSDVILIETDGDVAALTQSVYEVHIWSGLHTAPAIIGILPMDVAKHNPAVCRWDIGDHAALAALVTAEDPDFDRVVAFVIRRLKSGKVDAGN